MHSPKKILIVRNDKLGDFMLAWPSFALLRHALPDTKIHALVPSYTRPLAEVCTYIDAAIDDPGRGSGWTGFKQLTADLRNQHYDAVITLFSTGRIGLAVKAANIGYRLAPATKLAQICYNHRELQRRSRSEKPEWLYNVDLVRRFLADWRTACPVVPPSPYLEFGSHEIEILKNRFFIKFQIPAQDRLIFIHPGSGGSSNNLRPEQFADLAASLRSDRAVTFIVSAGPNERSIAEKLVSLMKGRNLSVCLYISNEGLVAFAAHLSLADLFISGSTGPLHIAGALNVRTVGFYPSKRSSTPLRWQTLSEPQRRLAFSPSDHSQDGEVLNIDINYTAKTINERFLSSSPLDE